MEKQDYRNVALYPEDHRKLFFFKVEVDTRAPLNKIISVLVSLLDDPEVRRKVIEKLNEQ